MPEPTSRKRRRTAAACIHCRRRKTKCDGRQPCAPCQTSNNACSYGSLSGRITTALYIKSLEKKASHLESVLARRTTDTLEEDLEKHRGTPGAANLSNGRAGHAAESPSQSSAPSEPQAVDEDVIETMIAAGAEDLADTTSLEHYRGRLAGLSLLQHVQNLCRQSSSMPRSPTTKELELDFVHAFDFTPPGFRSATFQERFPLLPLPSDLDHAIDIVINQACCNMQFLDYHDIRSIARHIYAEAETESGDRFNRSLALLYAVVALARRYEMASSNSGTSTDQAPVDGLRFFCASRAMLDPADCHNLISLQTLLCIILYAQASSMMSTCYSYICMAVAASLQMGLFTDFAATDLSEPELLCRRRIFTVLNMMDTYVTTALGLPKTLRDIISDQALPTPSKPLAVTDPLAGTYAHAQLIQILAAAVESNHPVTRPISQKNGFYGIEYSKITTIEDQLGTCFAQLPPISYTADTPDNADVVRSQLLLRLSYAQVQMVLYKPFLHHVLKDVRRSGDLSLKAYACGSSCIKAAMQVVWLAERLEACHLFNEAHWFTTLILAFTSSCLTLFVISNKRDPTLEETSDAVRRIRELCSRYAERNVSMQRCFKFLQSFPLDGEGIQGNGTPGSWNTFVQNLSSTFGDANGEWTAAGIKDSSSSGMLQALSLPFDLHSVDKP